MTDLEHKNLQLAASATAARTLMLWAAKLLAGALTHGNHPLTESKSAIQRKLSLAREDYLQMTFPEMPAVVSDMWAGEAQEAFDRLASELLDCIPQGPVA